MSIAVTSSLTPTTTDTPLDARVVVATLDDIASIQMPYVGMLFYCKATSKHYTVDTLASRTIGGVSVPNAAVGSYSVFQRDIAADTTIDSSSARPVANSAVANALTKKMDAPKPGSSGQVLTANGSGGYAWQDPPGGSDSSDSPGGSSTSNGITASEAAIIAMIFG